MTELSGAPFKKKAVPSKTHLKVLDTFFHQIKFLFEIKFNYQIKFFAHIINL